MNIVYVFHEQKKKRAMAEATTDSDSKLCGRKSIYHFQCTHSIDSDRKHQQLSF